MPVYKAPVDEVLFLLNDVFQISRYNNLPGFADVPPDVIEPILSEAAKLCEEVVQPLNLPGDGEGCTRHDDGRVTTPKGFKEAFKQYAEGGWMGISVPAEFGGQGLPGLMTTLANETLNSASMAFAMYPGLTQGAIAAILRHGTDDQKVTYLPKMVEGRWTGTMNLTEPHCGTDLGLLRTRAMPQGDGSYRLTGSKIFISGGEHDLSENIVHLVLARIEGAQPGIRGVSLFVVPKILPAADRAVGRRNSRYLRRDRREDGDPWQCHLRDELRRRNRLAGRRGESRHQRHVHDDERCATRRRRAGARAFRGRLSERGSVCEGPPAGPRADGGQVPRQGCRSDHRPSRRAARVDDPSCVQRIRARARPVDRLADRRRPSFARRRSAARSRRSHGPVHPGHQGSAHRHRIRQYGDRPASLWRAWLHCRARHGAVRAR